MRLNKLELRNYRNYQELVLEFPNRLNIFLGENAQGKTNLLESIYVLALTRSHRTSSEQELIGWQDDFAQIKGRIDRGAYIGGVIRCDNRRKQNNKLTACRG